MKFTAFLDYRFTNEIDIEVLENEDNFTEEEIRKSLYNFFTRNINRLVDLFKYHSFDEIYLSNGVVVKIIFSKISEESDVEI